MTVSTDDPNLTVRDSFDKGSGAWFEAESNKSMDRFRRMEVR